MEADFVKVGRMLASPARSAIVNALSDGRAMTATELARIASVGPSTASEHLAELVGAGLLRVAADGRHRYFTLAGPDVATALEALAQICPPLPVRSLRASVSARPLGFARTCYDHLAGTLGVAVLDALLATRWLAAGDGGFAVTDRGEHALAGLGVDVPELRARRRALARPCLDWTVRRPHLAGALGAAVTASLLERRWLERQTGRRALVLTPAGEAGLREILGVDARAEADPRGAAARLSAG
jgi:DNA-binding transcriptional ArsR family regulator